MNKSLVGNYVFVRLAGQGSDKGYTARLNYWGDRIAVLENDEQEFAIVHRMYEVKPVPSRMDIIGQNGNEGEHYDD